MITPPFTVSNKIPVTTSPATFRKQVLAGKRLIGVNVTDGGCAPADPVAAAKLLASYGVNWVRLHHIDRGLMEKWWTIEQILAFMDAGKANGIRFSVDGFSKLGEVYSPNNPAQFKRDLMDKVEGARNLYEAHLERIEPILKHSACFMVCLSNECAHLTTPDKAREFWLDYSQLLRYVNPNLLLTDAPDAWDQAEHPSPWADVAAMYDVITMHFYGGGEDFGSHGGGNWQQEDWKWWKLRLFRDQARGLAKRAIPAMIQEFGSYNRGSNPYIQNELFAHSMSVMEGMSTCQYSFASNQDCWDGKGQDAYCSATDRRRLFSLLYGSYLSKNAAGLALTKWEGKGGAGLTAEGTKARILPSYSRIGPYLWSASPPIPGADLVKVL